MTTEQQERRVGGRERIPFEALVVVNRVGGAPSTGGAFECESVNVSSHGMLLRTAYLPAEGESLACRFDTGTGEIEARGTVAWRKEQAKGGEFGVSFGALDDASAAALRALSGAAEPETRVSEEVAAASPGARVRLHIEGLGSPMRARVKDTESGAVMVGSNLDFLRVGRALELEDLDRGTKRRAVVERVGVETDSATNVPQLMVRLRYGDSTATAGDASSETVPSRSSDAVDSDAESAGPGALEVLRERAASALSTLGPRFGDATARAREAFSDMRARMRARRDEASADAPMMRTTTAAPEGGLTASGRRVVREGNGEAEAARVEAAASEARVERAKKPARRLVLASGAVLTAGVIAVLALKPSASSPPSAEVVTTDSATATLAKPVVAPGADVITARVPLFGATPLTTTEAAVPPAPAPVAPVAFNAPLAPPVAGPTLTPVGNEGDDSAALDQSAARFGRGKVKNAHIVRLKMDAPIADLKGSVSGSSIALVLPGRHNAEAAATLVKRDKRLAGVKTTPKGDGTEVTLTFKDDVPPFLAKATGRTLEVELGESANDDDGDLHAKKRHAKKGTAHAAHKDENDAAKRNAPHRKHHVE